MLVIIVQTKEIDETPVMLVTTDTNDWRKPIIEYLTNGKLSQDDKCERKLRVKALSFIVDNGVCIKKGVLNTSFVLRER